MAGFAARHWTFPFDYLHIEARGPRSPDLEGSAGLCIRGATYPQGPGKIRDFGQFTV